MITHPQRGFTLLIAVVLTSVLLSVGTALLDVAIKQITLSSTARQSQYAFYAADSAMECALYWDQQQNAFSYAGSVPSTIQCSSSNISVSSNTTGGVRESRFSMPCSSGAAEVIIRKTDGTVTCGTGDATSCIYSNGYSTCAASDPKRVERGLRVFY